MMQGQTILLHICKTTGHAYEFDYYYYQFSYN